MVVSLRTCLDVSEKVRQADEPDAANLAWALKAVGPHWRPVAVGRAGKDELVERGTTQSSEWAPGSRPWQPDVFWTGGPAGFSGGIATLRTFSCRTELHRYAQDRES